MKIFIAVFLSLSASVGSLFHPYKKAPPASPPRAQITASSTATTGMTQKAANSQAGVHASANAKAVLPTTSGGTHSAVTNSSASSAGVSASVSASTTVTIPAVAAQPAPQSFKIKASDIGADLTTITVPSGTPVTITFTVDAANTYYGGLDFRSSVVNTSTIYPGASQTIHFTATSSFAFTPYWPSSSVAKNYQIKVVVTP